MKLASQNNNSRQIRTSKRSTGEKSKNASLSDIATLLFGSIPIVFIVGVCAYVIYNDYVLNNYSFFNQSRYFSNVESHALYQNLSCSSAPPASSTHFCARLFTDFIISSEEATLLLKMSKQVFEQDGRLGMDKDTFYADVQTGQLSYQQSSLYNQKKNIVQPVQAYPNEQMNNLKKLEETIRSQIESKLFVNQRIYLTQPIFFSKLTNESRDLFWKPSADKSKCKACDYTAVIFLNDYLVDFNGGRLFMLNADDGTHISIQPKSGRLLLFTSGGENERYTERLQYGTSYSLTMSFTNDEKHATQLIS